MQLFSTNLIAANFTITGIPSILTIEKATAGQSPDSIQDVSTTYSLVVKKNNASITAFLTTALPKNTLLQVELMAPPGAKSRGPITLSATEQTLISNINKGTYNNLRITYTMSATIDAPIIKSSLQNVTYRLIDNG